MTSDDYDIADLLSLVATERAERLCLRIGQPPVIRLGGEPHPIDGPAISPEGIDKLVRGLATTRQVRELRTQGKTEFIYDLKGVTQYIVMARMQNDLLHLELERLNAQQ